MFPGWRVRPHIFALSTIDAQQLPEGHRMMVFMVMLAIHDDFAGNTDRSSAI